MNGDGATVSQTWLLGLLVTLLLAAPAHADIDLEWRPLTPTVAVGETAGLGLYAVSDSGENQLFSAVQVIMTWEIDYLRLTGTDETGGVGLFSSGFPLYDAFGLNEASPPADGDALWVGLAAPGSTLPAAPEGSLLTTILFEALAATPGTPVEMQPSGGNPVGYTRVIGEVPGLDVLGTIGDPALVQIVPEPGAASLLLLGSLALTRRRS